MTEGSQSFNTCVLIAGFVTCFPGTGGWELCVFLDALNTVLLLKPVTSLWRRRKAGLRLLISQPFLMVEESLTNAGRSITTQILPSWFVICLLGTILVWFYPEAGACLPPPAFNFQNSTKWSWSVMSPVLLILASKMAHISRAQALLSVCSIQEDSFGPDKDIFY